MVISKMLCMLFDEYYILVLIFCVSFLYSSNIYIVYFMIIIMCFLKCRFFCKCVMIIKLYND